MPPAPVSSQPTLAEIAAKATPTAGPAAAGAPPKAAPTGPKSNRVTPAVPLTVNPKFFTPPAPTADASVTNGAAAKLEKPAPSQAAMDEAARQAKEAVAAAMAKLNPQAAAAQNQPPPSTAAVDALTKKVAEMATSTTANGTARGGRGGFRGGRANYRGGAQKKMDIPKSDYDFESANAKFNKEDLIKEAIASGSPLEEHPAQEEGEADASKSTPTRKDSLSTTGAAYNKSTSFFDDISSESKDRQEGNDGRSYNRAARGEEFKKNVETFGQGNVDGGYRGRGRGGYGRGRQYGGTYRGGYNNRGYGGYNNYRGNRGRGGQGQGRTQEQEQVQIGQAAAQF